MFLALLAVSIKSNKESVMSEKKKLYYTIIQPRQKINLNLFEAEKYESAVLVQQLVGTLVYFSNLGRYETRLASSWELDDEKTWTFHLKDNLKCEDGELINATTFKSSLERMLLIFEKKGGVPILSSLVGYKEFITKNREATDIENLKPLGGIEAKGLKLTFKFDKKIKSGLLQILSFSPFGYISSKNLNSEGEWKNNSFFNSSGPYIVKEIKIGTEYQLERNPYWADFNINSPDTVVINHDDNKIDNSQAVIVDAFTNEYSNAKLSLYKLVPEYINSVLLGNLHEGYFSNVEHRKKFKAVFDKLSEQTLPLNFGVNSRSNTFYPSQKTSDIELFNVSKIVRPKKQLLIEGKIPIEGTSRWHSWAVLKKTLDALEFSYAFALNESSFAEITNLKYDLRIRGSSIGGGVEPWGIYVAFCSAVGIRFPDPQNQICKLYEDYELDLINDEQFTSGFLKLVEEQAAVLPVSHYGVQLYLSDKIDLVTLSPLLAIVKFDQLGVLRD